VLTTGADFPDALAGGPAAAGCAGPVLLTARDAVPPVVLAELARLAPQRVLLLGRDRRGVRGGRRAARSGRAAGGALAGAGRYETAALVSQTVFPPGVPVAYVATGADYPDALAGAAAAGAAGRPSCSSGRDALPAATARSCPGCGRPRWWSSAAPGAVSARVERQLASYSPTVRRIAGADRYATAAAVARTAPSRPGRCSGHRAADSPTPCGRAGPRPPSRRRCCWSGAAASPVRCTSR
jgi:hypothetical protein